MAQLGDDHERITSLSGEVRRALEAGDTVTAAAALDTLALVLAPDSALEEAGLYPELKASGITADGLYADHAAVDAAIKATVSGEPGAWEAVPHALELLDRHIHVEEYDLFPAAHHLLSDAAWDRIDQASA